MAPGAKLGFGLLDVEAKLFGMGVPVIPGMFAGALGNPPPTGAGRFPLGGTLLLPAASVLGFTPEYVCVLGNPADAALYGLLCDIAVADIPPAKLLGIPDEAIAPAAAPGCEYVLYGPTE